MLTLTDTASTAVKNLADRAIGAETGGLRISSPTDGSTGFAVALAAEPDPADAVIENDGARVFLDQAAAEAVSDKTLDAQIDGDGAVRFALSPSA